MRTIKFPYDKKTEIITIEGVAYHKSFFRKLADAKNGNMVIVTKWEDENKKGVKCFDLTRQLEFYEKCASGLQSVKNVLSLFMTEK